DLNSLTNGADNGINAEGQAGGIYDRTWTVENLGTTARRITVTVRWRSGKQSRSISISSNTRGNGV
ncbi:MAG: hypothetical protein P8X90_32200, partial [Desulfobacterales bacterium]